MTALADVALAFARECLGWQDASVDFGSEGVIWNGKLKEDFAGFHFTNLNAVMEAVRGWIAERPLGLEIHFGHIAEGFVVLLKRYEQHGKHRVMADAYTERNDDLGLALLAACVEAARKMKGAA